MQINVHIFRHQLVKDFGNVSPPATNVVAEYFEITRRFRSEIRISFGAIVVLRHSRPNVQGQPQPLAAAPATATTVPCCLMLMLLTGAVAVACTVWFAAFYDGTRVKGDFEAVDDDVNELSYTTLIGGEVTYVELEVTEIHDHRAH